MTLCRVLYLKGIIEISPLSLLNVKKNQLKRCADLFSSSDGSDLKYS